ncbi:MAG: DNA alkylation repair protein [Anaerolineae bacterium]|nr:DNA alkylation repair protein [Anaerolineae bacterium]MDK1081487.1 DNA alkylation repair protein [Anaerolineae bacterium]MDK1117969.1 DNA alkylation repair protein [Anaerolineae bacterium]
MPAIDLARLRKQANHLADFFFLPEDFVKHLRETLEFYVNRSLRKKKAIAARSNLPTYRTPPMVIRKIEQEINRLAMDNPHYALELADLLWDEGFLETRLLAAFLLGRIPPQEERLLARLTAWSQQVRDSNVRFALLTTSLERMRQETPDNFLVIIGEWLHPAREHLWSNGIQALIPIISDESYDNLPRIFDIIQPVFENARGFLQIDLGNLINALYEQSPSETEYFLHEVLESSQNSLTAVMLRRNLDTFPQDLQENLREMLRQQRIT